MNGSAFAGWFWSLFFHTAIVALAAALLAGLLLSKVPPTGEETNIVPVDVVDFSDFSNVTALSRNPISPR